jgi:predicted MFS family arabinose efflux permease
MSSQENPAAAMMARRTQRRMTMSITSSQRDSRTRTRAGLVVLFVIFGAALATWAVHLPTLQQRAGISTAQLGTVVLILGAGSVLSMQASRALVDRFGGVVVAVASAAAMVLTVIAPLAGRTFWWAGLGALVFGGAVGLTDWLSMRSVWRSNVTTGGPSWPRFTACSPSERCSDHCVPPRYSV